MTAWLGTRGSLMPRSPWRDAPVTPASRTSIWTTGGAVNAIEKTAYLIEAIRRLREEWRCGLDIPTSAPGPIVPTIIDGGQWMVSHPASAGSTVTSSTSRTRPTRRATPARA